MKSISQLICEKITANGAVHMSLLDPVSTPIQLLDDMINVIRDAESDFIMVGGSTLVDQSLLSNFITKIKDLCDLPVIIFPNNITSITKEADAIWFMSLLNSLNPYYIIEAQMLAAPYIRQIGIEPIPLAYLIVGEGKTVGFIGDAKPIPIDKPEIAAAYAIAAEIIGFKFIYLEAGSGATKPVPPNFVKVVKESLTSSFLIVGGGIRDPITAYNLVMAGADVIVTGTIIEKQGKLKDIVRKIKEAGERRRERKR